jgi:hypothetical protein
MVMRLSSRGCRNTSKTASANAKLDPKLDPNNSKDSKVKDIADAKNSAPTPNETAQEKPAEASKTTEPAAFPTNYWDIHGFTADGGEFIVVGEQIWSRKPQTTSWKMQAITEYFGKDFPLDQELEEKRKIEEELSKNQYEKTKSKVMDELRKFFRPELINRFDEVIIFEPLKYQHMLLIAELQLKGVKKMLEEQNMGFGWSHSSKKELVRQGFDPLYGARPLRRTIQKLIENPLSSLIIEKKLEENDMVRVDFDGAEFVFNIDKVKFIPESEAAKAQLLMKKFKCIESGHTFETEVKEGATVVCPINAKEKVEEIKSESAPILTTETTAKADESKKITPTQPVETAMPANNLTENKSNSTSNGSDKKDKLPEKNADKNKKTDSAPTNPATKKPMDDIKPANDVMSNPQSIVDKDLQGVQNILENKLGQVQTPQTA